MIRINRERVELYLFYFLLFDILFLPYFPLVSITFGSPIVIIWCIFNFNKIIKKVERKILLFWSIFLLLCLTSTFISIVIYPQVINGTHVWSDNIKRFGQFIITGCYYLYFYTYLKSKELNSLVKKVLLSFVFFMTLLAAIFILSKDMFHTLKYVWNPYDSFLYFHENNMLANYRYNFIWSDPNNPAYMLSVIYLFLNYNIGIEKKEKIFLIGCSLLSLIASMSIGGIVVFTVCLFFDPFLFFFKSTTISKTLKRRVLSTGIGLSVLCYLMRNSIINLFNHLFSKFSLLNEFWLRIISYEGVSRFEIWSTFLSTKGILPYIFIGTGYTTILNNSYSSPHNGNLLIFYAYGLIALICFLYLFLYPYTRKTFLSNLYLLPFFIGFSMNILIGEQKLLFMYIFIHIYARIGGSRIGK